MSSILKHSATIVRLHFVVHETIIYVPQARKAVVQRAFASSAVSRKGMNTLRWQCVG